MSSRSLGRLVFASLLALVCVTGCDECRDDEGDRQRADTGQSEDLETHAFDPPEPRDLTDLEAIEERDVDLSRAERFDECETIFEPEGTPEEHLPVARRELAITLVGCGAEAVRRHDEDWLIAYPSSTGDSEVDLRLVRYDKEGRLVWHHLLDRSDHAEDFRAQFDASYIAPLPPDMVCYGTRWIDETSTACLESKTGDPRWEGAIDAWLGIDFRGVDRNLVGATREGITRRYPFSGTEMRFKFFDETGGRAGFYAADSSRLFYVPSDGDDFAMTAYDLESFDPVWRLDLPDRPAPNFEHAFDAFGRVLLIIDETLYAVDSESAEVAWAADIGADDAPLVAVGDRLYLMLRREEDPNVLVALDPEDGRPAWRTELPNGILEVHALDETLLVKSVRAVREVRNLE
ncbi:MAG: PLuB system PQQ-binding repeat protein [Persicimonas sp.]